MFPAERQRLLLAREELPLMDVPLDFALVALKGNFLFDPAELDAFASTGLGLSRARMAAAISAGRVRLNGRTVSRPHVELQVGDVVALRGRGELRLQSRAPTRRQRWRLQLLRR